jgi:mannose-6-phosphate isomerase-like protein (cupin superfamily)
MVKNDGKTELDHTLHSHAHQDGMWLVLAGKVRFYGEGGRLIAELGPLEGILAQRGVKYRFERAGDEDLRCFTSKPST